MTVVFWVAQILGFWLLADVAVLAALLLAAQVRGRRPAAGSGSGCVELVGRYVPERPRMVPVYGDSGELVGWRLP